jgi:methyltransferase-like protein
VLLKTELEALRQASDSYLFHEQLEETNDPLYFYQFVERAAAKGLQFLGEAEISAMWLGNLPGPIAATLRGLSTDIIQMEQFMDFLRNRMFRQTLLCHKNIQVQRHLKPEHLKGKYISANLEPMRKPFDVTSNSMEEFRALNGVTISTSDAIMKVALVHLADAWPQAVQFDALLSDARQCLNSGPVHDVARLAEDAETFGNDILKCVVTRLADVLLRPTAAVTKASQSPLTTRVARRQGDTGNVVTNTRHELAQLSDPDRHVLRHLDGIRTRNDLLDRLVDLVNDKTLTVQQEGRTLETPEHIREIMSAGLTDSIFRLGRHGLLVG